MIENIYKKGKILTWVGFCGSMVFTLLSDVRVTGFTSLLTAIFFLLDISSYGLVLWGMALVIKSKKQSYRCLLLLLFYLFGIVYILGLEDKTIDKVPLPPKPFKSDKRFGFGALALAALVAVFYYYMVLALFVNGVQTQGVVLPNTPSDQSSHLSVKYTVNNKPYTTIDDTSFMPSGSLVVVHYNADDPSTAVFSGADGNILSFIVSSLRTYYIMFALIIVCLLVSCKALGLFGWPKSAVPISANTQ